MTTSRAVPSRDDPATWRAIADDTYDWESWLGLDGTPLWVNRAVERMTGYAVTECMAMDDYPLPIVHEEDRERMRGVLTSARSGSVGNDLEFRIRRKDGELRWLAMSWQSSQNARGEALGIRTSVRDIDDRKRLEIGLAEALRRAEAADRTKGEFLAMMSHELRSPLHSISGYAELMGQLALSEPARRFLDVIADQSQVMLRLVDELLEMSALEGGDPKLALASSDLVAVASDVVQAMRPLAEERGLLLTLDAPRRGTLVRTDARRVGQALTNLVSNAIKFTQQGSVSVRYEEHAVDRDHVEVRFQVRDTGIGIEPAQLPQVFEPFKQLEHTVTRRYGGVGLGLAITQRLARMLGAELRVESEPGRGSTFELSLRAMVSHERVAPERTVAPEDAGSRVDPDLAARHPLDILVVDDAGVSRELLREMLELHGYDPVVAASGVEAIEHARTHTFDLAILDYHMPVLDGPTVARALRRQHPQTRIVALTADALSTELLATGGFDEAWVKPLNIASLRRLLDGAAPTPPEPGERPRALIEARVVQDLKQTRGRDGVSMFERIAGRVAGDMARLCEELRPLVMAGEHARVSALAHSLKGHCLMVGARPAAEAAERLEAAAAATSRASSMLAFDALEKVVASTLVELQAERAAHA